MPPGRKGRPGGARKAPTNLSLRADLVRQARALQLNLSDLLERALERAIADRLRERWLADNREGIRSYNAQVEQRGVFSDGWRRF
ncbi:MAG: type II toxin-antitoxin system CcdA family antitoxin [bacterium]|nr:type II toxin-antitoxin system CcdA family antitoxin [bacterium]